MKQLHLLLTMFLISCISLIQGQTIYETFEGDSANLNWQALNGIYDGVVDNIDTAGVNSSAKVGSYTKSGEHAFSLFLAELAEPMDLSVNNQFKLQVYSPVKSRVLLKLEGMGGAIEATQNIVSTNVWREYTFDFSAAAGNTGLTKIIIFFDPGNATSSDTYLFDNLVAEPAGPCAGTTADPAILDDFECQRNISYGAGWDILKAVPNPDASGINTSSMAGEYPDPPGPWTALVADNFNAIDLSELNTYKAKVWAPKTGRILFKLEGGASPAKEVFVDITETNTWVEYSADFSSEANANHTRFVLFFNAGVEPDSGDVYYVDDISRAPTPRGRIWEDFEGEDGPALFWEPLNGNTTVHGTFNGAVDNPNPDDLNNSDKVACYTKGTSNFSSLSAILGSTIDLSSFTQFNLDVLAPANATKLTMQLQSPTQGVKDVVVEYTPTGAWQTISFDFAPFANITDFEQINLLFDQAQQVTDPYYFDNLTQGETTVDPCEGVAPIDGIIDDFECQRNVSYGAGNDRLEVVLNPDVSQENASTQVGKYTDPQDQWSALVLEFGQDIDLSVRNQFVAKIWSPAKVPLLFKLEGGSSAPREIWVDVETTETWVEYVVDFSPYAGESHQKVAIFFNAGQMPAQEDTYYIDDMSWRRAGFSGCIIDYESNATSLTEFTYFANGDLEGNLNFSVEDNPSPDGVNGSAKVGKFVKAGNALPFAGIYTDLEAPIDFKGNKTVKAKVLMDHIGNFAVKLEGSQTGAPALEIPVANTKTDEWEELTFDFSDAEDDAKYARLTLFFDLTIDATGEDVTSYFDDLIIGDGTCNTVGIFNFKPVEKLHIYPNPFQESLVIEHASNIETVKIYNTIGQLIKTIPLNRQPTHTFDVSDLKRGVYVITAYDAKGLIANKKVMKM